MREAKTKQGKVAEKVGRRQEDVLWTDLSFGLTVIRVRLTIGSKLSGKKEHVAVSHATPMTNAAELAAVKKQAELNAASLAELTDLVMSGGSKA